MYLALIFLPIFGSIFAGFFGRQVGVRGSQLITCSCLIITTLISILMFFEIGFSNTLVTINLFRWLDSEYLNLGLSFTFDSLTVSMLIPVLIISSLVHIYSIGYMSHDPHNQRFFSYLSLFTFMMIILVTGDSYLLMFVGWEGVGVCSYLLVSFWFTRIAANQSSIAAFLTNRVGDCILTLGMFGILLSFGNLEYITIFSLASIINENILVVIGVCLLIGAMAKSSQIGLHVWLPMAMEGPTPVSALIHAATMVTAGVYLLIRSSPLIEYSSTVLLVCLWIGAITTVFSSLIGLFQQDIKKVIAYSTMSQLGMMVIAIGLSSYNVALFHLINHAFYKGLLFLGAGAVIHAVADNQDFRKYGGLVYFLPLSYSVMLIASLSLVAFPFMTGFYSKDFIIESAFGSYYISSISIYFIATIAAMFTTLYSVKVLYLTFLTNPNGPLINYKLTKGAHEGNLFMSVPLIFLAIFSIFFGFITKDIYIGLGSDFFADNSIYIHPSHEIMLDTEFFLPTIFKLLPFFFTILLISISLIYTEYLPKHIISFKNSYFGYNIFSFFNQRFIVELLYNKYIYNVVFKIAGQMSKIMDKGVVERFGPHGLETKFTSISVSINSLSTGIVTSYALYILVGLLFFISVIYLLNQESYKTILPLILIILLISTTSTKTLASHKSDCLSILGGTPNLPLYSLLNNYYESTEDINDSIYLINCIYIFIAFFVLISFCVLLCSTFGEHLIGQERKNNLGIDHGLTDINDKSKHARTLSIFTKEDLKFDKHTLTPNLRGRVRGAFKVQFFKKELRPNSIMLAGEARFSHALSFTYFPEYPTEDIRLEAEINSVFQTCCNPLQKDILNTDRISYLRNLEQVLKVHKPWYREKPLFDLERAENKMGFPKFRNISGGRF